MRNHTVSRVYRLEKGSHGRTILVHRNGLISTSLDGDSRGWYRWSRDQVAAYLSAAREFDWSIHRQFVSAR